MSWRESWDIPMNKVSLLCSHQSWGKWFPRSLVPCSLSEQRPLCIQGTMRSGPSARIVWLLTL